jgi:HEAT repeat protein
MSKRVASLFIVTVVLIGCHAQLPPQEGKSVPELQSMLSSADSTTQAQAAIGLSKHGAAALPALSGLTGLLNSPRPMVRQQAALAIGQIGPQAAEAVPALTARLEDDEWIVRRQAALALGAIGKASRPALPALQQLERDPFKKVSEAAKEAKAKINEAGS